MAKSPKNLRCFAVVGDVHGRQERLLKRLLDWQQQHGRELSFILQVGDFEAIRHKSDLKGMKGAAHRRRLGDFPKFLKGQLSMPWPLYFIGGNHEPYSYLDDCIGGETLCENMIYWGRVGQRSLEGLKISGLSGIFIPKYFSQPHEPPEVNVPKKQRMSFNDYDVQSLLSLGACDILLSHDWPTGLVQDQDRQRLGHIRRNAPSHAIGNKMTRNLMRRLKPQWLFCGHMHQAFRAEARHPNGQVTQILCLDAMDHPEQAIAYFEVDAEGQIQQVLGADAPTMPTASRPWVLEG